MENVFSEKRLYLNNHESIKQWPLIPDFCFPIQTWLNSLIGPSDF